MKYLKTRPDSDVLAFQRAVPTRLKRIAKALGLPQLITLSFHPVRRDGITEYVTQSTLEHSPVLVAEALSEANRRFTAILSMLERSDNGETLGALGKAEWQESAYAYLDARGVPAGALDGLDPRSDEYQAILEEALGHQTEPEARTMPRDLYEAIGALLTQPIAVSKVHLFSDAINYYVAFRTSELKRKATGDADWLHKKRILKKDWSRLEGFAEYVGEREFTTEACNSALRQYRQHLMAKGTPAPSIRRTLNAPAAAFRLYADEIAHGVNIARIVIRGADESARTPSVLTIPDVKKLLAAAQSGVAENGYVLTHLARLAIYGGIFSGASARELVNSRVSEVFSGSEGPGGATGYWVLRGTKTATRTRPAAIIDDVHRELLLTYADGGESICGDRVAAMTESGHSSAIKEALWQCLGFGPSRGPKKVEPVDLQPPTPYSLRHTGKHILDSLGVADQRTVDLMFGWRNAEISSRYGRAGVYNRPIVEAIQRLVEDMKRVVG